MPAPVAAERTSIDDWIDDGDNDEGDEMEFENGNQAPQTPEVQGDGDQSPSYSPTTPRGSDSEAEMDTGMIGLLKTCSGREDVKQKVQRDAEEIMRIVRDLGGSTHAYKKERSRAMKPSWPKSIVDRG
jgi:hypothetical protein